MKKVLQESLECLQHMFAPGAAVEDLYLQKKYS
jgi:hypothetical protein